MTRTLENNGQTGSESAGHRKVLASSLLGTTVEWYDFFLYSTASSLVFGRLFFPAGNELAGSMMAFGTFFVGFLARPLGAVLFGHIGDRLGRKRTLVTTMLLMGVATALVGVLPTYEQVGLLAPALLIVLRVLQGLSIGGEWAGAVLLAVEYAPAGRRGWYGSWPQVGLGLGLAMGAGLFALLGQLMNDAAFLSYGWRIAFLLSIALVVVGLVVRLRIAETPAFREMNVARGRDAMPFVRLFRERLSRRHVLLGLLARWGDGVAFNTWGVFAITYCTTVLGVAQEYVLTAVTFGALLMAALIPVMGRVVDRVGARRGYLAGMVLFGLSVYPAFLGLETRNPWVVCLVLVGTLGVGYAISYSPVGTLFAQLFPTPTRYTGMSVVYQFSGIYASGLTPMLITSLFVLGSGDPWWVCAYLVTTAVISVLATVAIRPEQLHLTEGSSEAVGTASEDARPRLVERI